MPRMQRFSPAADALDPTLFGQGIDVATDGRFRGFQQLHQLTDTCEGAFGDDFEDQLVTLRFQHLQFPRCASDIDQK
jgi:hypothetical protein